MWGEGSEGGIPDIFALAVELNAMVAEHMSVHGGEVVWHPHHRHAAFDWEIPRVVTLLARFQNARVCLGQVDCQV